MMGLTLWLLICLSGLADVNCEVYTSIVKGVFYQEMKKTIIYQKSLPVSFVVDLPQIVWKDSTNESCPSEPQICALKQESSKIHKEVVLETLTDHPYLRNTPTRNTRGLIDAVGIIDKYLFGLATTADVDALHAAEGAIVERLKQLQNGMVDEHKYLVDLSGNISAWSSKLSNTFQHRLDQVSKHLISTAETIYKEEGVLGQVALDIMKNQYLMYTTNKINLAAESCRNNRIPRTILKDISLNKRLKTLEKKLLAEGYEYAVSVQRLMKMDISDCFFTERKLHVTVHVPLRLVNTSYKLFEVLAVPWQFGNQQCRVMDVTPFVAKVGSTVMPISGHVARYCMPQVQNACYIPENEKDSSSFSDCAKAIFHLFNENIKKFCIFHCFNSNTTRVTEISPGQVAVTNAKTIQIKCKDSTKNKYIEAPASDGAILLSLPCFCSAVINDVQIIKSPFPCLQPTGEDVDEVTHIIPVQWSLLSSLLLQDNAKYSNLSEILDTKWAEKIPTLNLTTPLPLPEFTLSNFKLDLFSTEYDQDKLFFLLWITLITLFIAIQYCCARRTKPISGKGRLALLFVAVACKVHHVKAENDSTEKNVSSLAWDLLKAVEIANWIIAIFVGLSGLVIIWVVVRLYKFTRCTYQMTRSLIDDIEIPRRRL